MLFWSAFMLGLMGSLHCVGMCGPIAMALPLTAREKSKVIFHSLMYQFGRATTYGLMGMLIGTIGWGITLGGYQKVLSIALGILLIVLAIFSISVEQKVMRNTFVQSLFSGLQSRLSRQLSIGNNSSAFKIGLLNGFLPCGLVYMALAGAVVGGSAVNGALYMMIFGLGTIPLMMAVMIFGKFGKHHLMGFRKLIPYALVLFGIYLVYRGMMLEVPVDLGLLESGDHSMKCH